MPPKGGAKGAKAQDKAKQAAKSKTVEDKTFGLKNKSKSSKVQKYVQQLQQQVQPPKKKVDDAEKRKADKKKADEELASLFAMAIKQPKVPVGVDPKSIVCEYFRHGQCTKGFKCKFSHDLAVERKGGKADLFTDKRNQEQENEGMEDWDQETLEKAIAQKHAADNRNRPTEIVCKYFLDAVEKKQYGWFWNCPSGKECKYRHALPPGYVLKSQMKELLALEAANSKSVEEIIEEERSKIDAKTPITVDSFKVWKAGKDAAKRKIQDEKENERKRKGIMTGREIFAQENFVVTDDAGASGDIERENDDAEIDQMYKDAAAAQEAARAREAAAAQEVPSNEDKAEPSAGLELTEKEAEDLFDDDDDDIDDDLLDDLAEDLEKAAVVGS